MTMSKQDGGYRIRWEAYCHECEKTWRGPRLKESIERHVRKYGHHGEINLDPEPAGAA